MSQYPQYLSPKETGQTFKENALIKAQCFYQFLKSQPMDCQNLWVIGEDSGLEVKALDGKPGIYSARYKKPQASDADNLNHLLHEMKAIAEDKRHARFICHIVAFSKTQTLSCQGVVKGYIMTEGKYQQLEKKRSLIPLLWPTNWPRFGYDPVFVPEGEKKSFFDLGVHYKNRHSHRFQAVKKLKLMLESTR